MRQTDRNCNLPKKSSLPFDPSLLTKSSSDIKPAEIFVLQHILGLENNCQNIITKYTKHTMSSRHHCRRRRVIVSWIFVSCPKKILRCVRMSWFEQWKEITIHSDRLRWHWLYKSIDGSDVASFHQFGEVGFTKKKVRLCFHINNPIFIIVTL